jgi:hypothetical protein
MIRLNNIGSTAFAMRAISFREHVGTVSFDAFTGTC